LELAALGTRTKLVETATGLCGFEINRSVPKKHDSFPSTGVLLQDLEVEVDSQQDSNRKDQSGVAHLCHLGEVGPQVVTQTRSQEQGSNLKDQSGVARREEAGPDDPERLASALMVQKDFSFEALRRLVEAIPLKSTKKHRDSQGGRGCKIQGMVAGVWAHGSQYGIAKTASKWPKSIEYINRFMKLHGGNQWSSFLLAKNVKTRTHKDNHNASGSVVRTVTFGDFQGGELWVAASEDQFRNDKSQIHWRKDRHGVRRPGVLVDTREKPYDLDPKIDHATQHWKGGRWCLSIYTSRGAEHIDEEDRNQLKKLGFPSKGVSAARRKNEYASAIAARTKVTEAALMAHDLNRLKAIWDVVKPKKRVSLLPSNWKKKDLEGLKEIYSGTVVPHMELPDDKHWSRWGKAKLILEISTWEDQVKESADPLLDYSDLFEEYPLCESCGIPLTIRCNRLTHEEFFGCLRFPLCRTTLPLNYNGRPTGKVQKELIAKKEASHMTSEKGKGKEEYPLFRPRGRAACHEISSSDEAKFNVNLTKEEMDEIMMRRKGKGDGKKDLKQEAGAEVKK
ncbi:unnamed protein product, partial [Symbiodinium pilosum]